MAKHSRTSGNPVDRQRLNPARRIQLFVILITDTLFTSKKQSVKIPRLHPGSLIRIAIGSIFLWSHLLGCTPQTSELPDPTSEATIVRTSESPEIIPTEPEMGETPSRTPNVEPSPTHTPEPVTEEPTAQEPISMAKRIPILEYHHSNFKMAANRVIMTTDWFLEQMDWLDQNDFYTLSAQDLIDYIEGNFNPPQRSVVLTFDIGTSEAEDFRETIIPKLKEHKFTALFFVLTTAITDDGVDNSLTWNELADWQQEGIITVESHGVYHPDYQLLTYNQMIWDAKTSFDVISEKTGTEPMIFGYPFDSVPEEPERVMQDAGYVLALAGHREDRSIHPLDPDRFMLPRYYPYSNEEIYPILSDGYGWSFPEMMISAITESEDASTVSPTIPTPEAVLESNQIPPTLKNLVQFCQYAGEDALYQLDEYAKFPTNVSPMAQTRLTHPVVIKPTCHFAEPIIPESIILHFTEGAYSAAVNEFRESELEASIHYIIDRNGSVTQMVPEFFGAHHVTCYGNRAMCTRTCPICEDDAGILTEPWTRSIGIELVNNGRLRGSLGDFKNPDDTPFEGLVFEDYLVSWSYRYWEDYPIEQVDALRILVEDIMARWDIPFEMVLGHSRIQLNKNDPGPALNLTWARYGDPPRDPIFVPTPAQ